MTFVSWQFLAFFVLLLGALYIMPTRQSRQLTLLVASAIFYGMGTTWHLLVLAVPAAIDFACAIRIEDARHSSSRKHWLLLSLISNLGLLAYFKYADFFVDSIGALFGAKAVPLGVLLPVGISFFIFKTLSYTIDVYRREIPACRSLWRYAMFVSYFPELVAGPIVRASVFMPQMDRHLQPSLTRATVGVQLILLGLTKKLFIADRLATFVNPVFATPGEYSQLTVISAVVAYSIQIYCDFSGYSDMAIGISKIIGFDLPENFNMPYASTSIAEFWRRWHITLSTWLRDYLYIPLGGNRNGSWRTYLNLMVTMLLGGLWHGASWTFVIWGLLHGIGLGVHKVWRSHVPETHSLLANILGWTTTYCFVCLTWVFFRASDFTTAALILRKIAGLEPDGVSWTYLPLLLILPIIIAAHVAGIWIAAGKTERSQLGSRLGPEMAIRPHRNAGFYFLLPRAGFSSAFIVTIWIVSLFLLSPVNVRPFIYFQF